MHQKFLYGSFLVCVHLPLCCIEVLGAKIVLLYYITIHGCQAFNSKCVIQVKGTNNNIPWNPTQWGLGRVKEGGGGF